MKITVLGSGSAYGTPMAFNYWGQANPENPKNRRMRASILLEDEGKRILIDAGPDFRNQINQFSIPDIDAVFLTHGHYDHIAGVPELPRASKLLRHKIGIYASEETMAEIKNAYGYLFSGGEAESAGLAWELLPDCGKAAVGGLPLEVFQVPHHHLMSSGFRYKNFVYVTDWQGFSDEAAAVIDGADLLLAECNNGFSPESNGHSSWPEIEKRLKNLKIGQIVLGHLSARVDYDAFKSRLPEGIVPAYDGLVLEL